MTATRINRKRSHDDLDDADECLPISKRINSLHIEGQTHAASHHQVLIQNQLNPLHDYCENVASTSSPIAPSTGQEMYEQHFSMGCLDLANRSSVISEHSSLSGGSADARYSALNFSPEMPDSDVQMAPGQMIYSSPAAAPNPLSGQYGMYHQTVPQTHLAAPYNPTVQAFPNQALSSSMPPATMDLIRHNTSHGTPNPINGHAIIENCDRFEEQQIPEGPYEPELGISENPHYFSVNRLLYEAHLSRVQRTSSF